MKAKLIASLPHKVVTIQENGDYDISSVYEILRDGKVVYPPRQYDWYINYVKQSTDTHMPLLRWLYEHFDYPTRDALAYIHLSYQRAMKKEGD